MPKPIIVVSLRNPTRAQLEERRIELSNLAIKEEYWILCIPGDENKVTVFFEKDQVTLDKDSLERLLALAK